MTYENYRKVIVGGGGGVSRLLQVLRTVTHNLISIQTGADDGGNSKFWRDMLDCIAPGDFRRAISALSDPYLPWSGIMDHVFPDGTKLGNALVAWALASNSKDSMLRLKALCDMMGVSGKVLPVSLKPAKLMGWDSKGKIVAGESVIDKMGEHGDESVNHVYLEPRIPLYVGAREALLTARIIIFAPGDPFTSIYPNIVVSGFWETIHEWKANNPEGKIGMVCNLLTKKSESPGWKASHFARGVTSKLRLPRLDFILVNDRKIPEDVMTRYEAMGSYQVEIDSDLADYADKIYRDDFLEIVTDPVRGVKTVRHNDNTATVLVYQV